jgi:hypothetical protein
MSKAVNLLLTLMVVPTVFLALFIGADLNALGVIKGNETKHIDLIFNIIAVASGILLVWRAFRRWSAYQLFKTEKNFVWVGVASMEHINRMRLYFVLESIFFICLSIFFYWATPLTFLLALVFLTAAIENFIFVLLRCNKTYMKAGITKNSLVLANRDLSFFYFTGLTNVSTQNKSIYMEYRNGLCLDYPINAISKEQRSEFLKHFIAGVDKKKVFVSEKLWEV